MNTKQLILKSAIGVFAFFTILSGCVMVFGQKKTELFQHHNTCKRSEAGFVFQLDGNWIDHVYR